jgi:hypothetical protein
MSKKEEADKILRQLSPENQANLLPFFRLAQVAENSVKKSIVGVAQGDGGMTMQMLSPVKRPSDPV